MEKIYCDRCQTELKLNSVANHLELTLKQAKKTFKIKIKPIKGKLCLDCIREIIVEPETHWEIK
ncbi:MAG: hypothetical protein DSO01_06685 [Archaeoglobi archaeon]|nr:MAG: hypothetical protein DSO01_06685 [Archaeoglobi archaeon]